MPDRRGGGAAASGSGKSARRLLVDFQRKFPQLFFAAYFGTFRELPSLRQFGFWLLNRGAFVDVDVQRPNEAGILLSVDVGGSRRGSVSAMPCSRSWTTTRPSGPCRRRIRISCRSNTCGPWRWWWSG